MSLELIGRIKTVIESNGLTASAFADQIGVQRSSVSHILSGRNKPSLDFILKMLDTYPEIEAEWLIKGISKEKTEEKLKLPFKEEVKTPVKEEEAESNLFTNVNREVCIERIVIFYTNGKFKEYSSE